MTGKFAHHLDKQLGISYEDLEGMSIRHQKIIITKQAEKMHKA